MEKQARETLASLSVRTVSSVRQLVANLSGGQRQTVAIAKAVLWNSKVVFLDEPTAALGVAQTRQVLDLVRRLADQGRGVVLISHNMNDVMEVADRVAALYLGRIAAEVKNDRHQHHPDRRADHRPAAAATSAWPPPPPTRASEEADMSTTLPSTTASRHAARRRSRRRVLPRRRGALDPRRHHRLGRQAPQRRPGRPAVGARPRRPRHHLHAGQRPVPVHSTTSATCPGQGSYIAIIALGLVFVLLLGEIDLSAGTAGGTCAALAAVGVFSGNLHRRLPGLLYWALVVGLAGRDRARHLAEGLVRRRRRGASGWSCVVTNLTQHLFLALVAAVCIGAAIGVLNGYLVAKVGIPSFVVTLALFLAWQGVLQFALNGQPINTSNYELWYDMTYGNLSPLWSWVFTIVVVGGYLAYTLSQLGAAPSGRPRARRAQPGRCCAAASWPRSASCSPPWPTRTATPTRSKVIEGIPWAAVIAIVLMIALHDRAHEDHVGPPPLRHRRQRRGRAPRRHRRRPHQGHRVHRCARRSARSAASSSPSSQSSASLDLGSGNVLLFSVAAAVIGGTSLFGGRGKPRDAIIGALVIAIIPNGTRPATEPRPQWQQSSPAWSSCSRPPSTRSRGAARRGR